MGAGIEAEDPLKLSIRSFIFIFLAFYAEDIVNLLLGIAGTPYDWILTEELPSLDFASFKFSHHRHPGCMRQWSRGDYRLILVLILAWNYIKLLFEAAERYILLGVLVYTRGCFAQVPPSPPGTSSIPGAGCWAGEFVPIIV